MDKVIIIGLVSLVTILVINLYEAYRIIQILLNKFRELNRELFESLMEEYFKEKEDETK